MNIKRIIRKVLLLTISYKFIYFIKKNISINYLLFGPAKKNIGRYLEQDRNHSITFKNLQQTLEKDVYNGFNKCLNEYKKSVGLLRKYVLEVEDCYIEPNFGWCIKDNKLVFDSISNNSWREAYHPSYLQYRNNHNKAEFIPEVISLNIIPGGEKNYWHFLHDLLGGLALIQNHLNREVPILISKDLAEQSFFKAAISESIVLKKCTWLVRNTYYKVGKAYFIQVMPNSCEQFNKVFDYFPIPAVTEFKNRRIFLKRNEKRIRFINNCSEIEEIVAKWNFEVIDCDELKLREQISLFNQTKYVVAIHGAGLVNILYRKNSKMKLLEIFPKDYIQPHYYLLTKCLGFTYSCLIGGKTLFNTSFYVDPIKFEKKLLELIDDK